LYERDGIFGGLTGKQRRRERRERLMGGVPATEPAQILNSFSEAACKNGPPWATDRYLAADGRWRCRAATRRPRDAAEAQEGVVTREPYRRDTDKPTLGASCWCMAKIVAVPREDIAAGLTRSCGRPACDDHDRNHRNASEETQG